MDDVETVTTIDLVREVGGWPIDLAAVGTLLARLRAYGGYGETERVPPDRRWSEADLIAAGLLLAPTPDGGGPEGMVP